ncbi:hypothetical protein FB550_108190 [Neobacillus bataviensis]|uniref:Uncharacterized protein n=1 Tax=Neobacillus bataviensis TaxID=220685 RepID=A0A561D673_9BACI|nr:hypothetical protein FB550_108190 [Neobacillus bataviensis]
MDVNEDTLGLWMLPSEINAKVQGINWKKGGNTKGRGIKSESRRINPNTGGIHHHYHYHHPNSHKKIRGKHLRGLILSIHIKIPSLRMRKNNR